jgi:hypothetical protein
MLFVDKMILAGVQFALDKVARAAEEQLNDDGALREELMAAQMQLELGEITDAEFANLEADILVRLREIQERKQGGVTMDPAYQVTGVEVSVDDDVDGGPPRRR